MKTAVVTGAGGGLGRAITAELARRGFAMTYTLSTLFDLRRGGHRGIDVRFVDLFPRLSMPVVPKVMRDARRRQQRYKRLTESGQWP